MGGIKEDFTKITRRYEDMQEEAMEKAWDLNILQEQILMIDQHIAMGMDQGIKEMG